jgi:hypothetical protein
MDATQVTIVIGLLIVAIAILGVYVLWLKTKHHHKSKTTVD